MSRWSPLAVLIALAAPTLAQITVTADGSASAAIDTLILRATLRVDADLGEESVTKYLAARRRVDKGFAELGVEGLRVEGSVPRVEVTKGAEAGARAGGIVFIGPGNAQREDAEAKVKVVESVRLVLAGLGGLGLEERLRRISKTVDSAKDLGLDLADESRTDAIFATIGSRSSDRSSAETAPDHLPTNPAALEAAAYAAAVKEAKERAARLARPAGLTLGKIRAVRVLSASLQSNGGNGELVHEVRLEVVFETT